MKYDPDTFFALADMIEDIGGAHLDEMCDARTFDEFSGAGKSKPLILAGCGESALFEFPYQAHSLDGEGLGVYPIKLCAVDDAVGAFPRFGGDALASLDHRQLFDLAGDTLYKNDPRVMGR